MRTHAALAFLGIAALAGCSTPRDPVPDTVLLTVPGVGLDTADPSPFAFGCSEDDCTFECSLDGAAFSPCDATSSFRSLSPGTHTLAARAIGADGDVDPEPVTHSWSLVFAWAQVDGAGGTLCAITGAGTLHCWGRENSGELGDGGGARDASDVPLAIGTADDWEWIAAGEYAYCGRRAQGVFCWGNNYDEQFGDPSLPDLVIEPTPIANDFASMALGDDHTCGIDDAGALHCWGSGYDGKLGLGDEDPRATPTRVGTGTWAQVAVSSSFSCGVDSSGALHCWGSNYSGESGEDPLVDDLLTAPHRIGVATDWVRVRTGGEHACAIASNGRLACWGSNDHGQLGDGSTTASHVPIVVPGTYRDVVAGETGTCAVSTDGDVSCWGDNERAQLGTASLAFGMRPTPGPIDATDEFTAVGGRGHLRCALGANDLRCWGDNQNVSGGLGAGIAGYEPQVVELDGGYVEVATNEAGGCGRRTDGTLACWGAGPHVGQDDAFALVPTAVSARTDWYDVDVSGHGNRTSGHACGLAGGSAYCWGTGIHGQLGDGTATDRAQPVAVTVSGESFRQISTGQYSTCAVTDNSTLYCWGGGTNALPLAYPNYGQVGDGTQLQRNAPVAITVPAASGWAEVRVYAERTTALRSDGTIWAWGRNPNGAIASSPTQIGTEADWVEVMTTGSGASCARKANGSLHCTDYTFQTAWARPLVQVGSALTHTALVPFPGGACSIVDGAVHCYTGNDAVWTDNSPWLDVNQTVPAPSGTFTSFSGTYASRCGVRTNGTRACAGGRFAGSLGDGVDERVPRVVTRP